MSETNRNPIAAERRMRTPRAGLATCATIAISLAVLPAGAWAQAQAGTSPATAVPLAKGQVGSGNTANASGSCVAFFGSYRMQWYRLLGVQQRETMTFTWTDAPGIKNRLAVFRTSANDSNWCSDGSLSGTSYVTGTTELFDLPAGGTRTITLRNANAGDRLFAIFTSPYCLLCTDTAGAFTVSATTQAPTPPDPPTRVSASIAEPNRARVSFSAPQGTYGFELTGYAAVCTSPTGGATREATGAGSPIEVGDLSLGHTYACAVRAQTEAGSSSDALASSTIAVPLPNAQITAMTAVRRGRALTVTGVVNRAGVVIVSAKPVAGRKRKATSRRINAVASVPFTTRMRVQRARTLVAVSFTAGGRTVKWEARR